MSVVMSIHRSGRKHAAGLLIALALCLSGVFVVAAPASAAPAECASGYHCNYSGYDYGNDAFQGPATHGFLNCVDRMYIGLRAYGNTTSSAYNNGRTQASYLYPEVARGGVPIKFARGAGTPNLGTRGFNDTAESGYFESTRDQKGTALCR